MPRCRNRRLQPLEVSPPLYALPCETPRLDVHDKRDEEPAVAVVRLERARNGAGDRGEPKPWDEKEVRVRVCAAGGAASNAAGQPFRNAARSGCGIIVEHKGGVIEGLTGRVTPEGHEREPLRP